MVVPVEGLLETKYGQVICYPRCDPETLRRRIEEVKRAGVKAIVFSGSKLIEGIPVLGKGCVGIVVMAITEDERKVAIKILRTDAEPKRLLHEAEMLRIANSVGVGPRLLGSSENLLLMEYIEGELLPKWVEGLSRERGDTRIRLGGVLRDVLEQCWRLDNVGLDHGELSWADKHIIVDPADRPHILDFETASNRRRVSNVTSIAQYLFIKSRTAEVIAKKFGPIDKDALIQALREYKAKRTREQFELILNVVGLL